MKKGLFFCLLFLLQVSGPVSGAEVLTRRLSISFQEMPIKEALDNIARMADFEWSYNARILNPNQRVTVSVRDWTVREILREILGEEYVIKSSGRYLILKKEKPPKKEVSGVIRATQSGERLANVTIYDRKTLRATTTDSSGYYQLKVKRNTELVVVRKGFQDTILQVASITPRYRNLELNPVPVLPADTANLTETIRQTLQKAVTEVDHFFNAGLDKWHALNVSDTLQRRFQMSLLPMVGTNHVLSGKVENDFSINILAGQSAGVRYFEAASLGNFTRNKVSGFQAAGLFNLNRGVCTGVQAAGLYNLTADTLSGVQLSGLINEARQSPHLSVQAAGLINIIRKNGAQAGDEDPPNSVQLAGLLNRAESLDGVQVAGLINTTRDIKGVQVSGLINRAKRVKGIQIGVFNTANELHGVQIGLLNRSGKRWLPILNWGRKR